MLTDLRDKVALVTGAGKGIGKSIALFLAGAGVDKYFWLSNPHSNIKALAYRCKGFPFY